MIAPVWIQKGMDLRLYSSAFDLKDVTIMK
jgi:hypothetical protein